MGTSNRSSGSGSGTPLVPSFLTDGGPPNLGTAPSGQQPGPPNGVTPASPSAPPTGSRPPIPRASTDSERFRPARAGVTRFARNRDRETLRRAIGSYVRRGTGGRTGATGRMGSSRSAAAALGGFVRTVQTAGTAEALRSIGLAACIGRPAADVLPHLLETLCPDGGRIDEGIAREAFQNAIVEFAAQDLPTIDQLTAEQWRVLLIDFVVRSIQLRIIADIGQRIFDVPTDVATALAAETVMHNIIQATVQHQLGEVLERLGTVSEDQVRRLTDEAYERAWGAFEAFADE